MIIVIVAGILAALVLFRGMRTLALFTIAAIVIAFIIQSHSARSEEIEFVRCYPINYKYSLSLPRGVCRVFEEGAARIIVKEPNGSIMACQNYIFTHSKSSDPRYDAKLISICHAIWEDKVDAAHGW